MAVVGEASVVITALTADFRRQIRDVLTDVERDMDRDGKRIGATFSSSFAAEVKRSLGPTMVKAVDEAVDREIGPHVGQSVGDAVSDGIRAARPRIGAAASDVGASAADDMVDATAAELKRKRGRIGAAFSDATKDVSEGAGEEKGKEYAGGFASGFSKAMRRLFRGKSGQFIDEYGLSKAEGQNAADNFVEGLAVLPERVGVIFQRTAARMRTSWASGTADIKKTNESIRESMSDLNRSIDGVRDSMSAARREFKNFDSGGAKGVNTSMRRASAGFKAFRTEMGKTFSGRERSGMSRLGQSFAALGRTIRRTAGGIALAVSGIARAVGTVGQLLGGFAQGVMNAIRGFMSAMTQAATTVGTIVAIAGGLSTVVAGIGQLVFALGPLLAIFVAMGPALAIVVPAIMSLGAVAGGAFAALSGVGGALQAVRQDSQGAEDAAKAAEQAMKRVKDAQEGVADAQRARQQALADAARRIADAERALARAREDAARRLEDAQRAVGEASEDAARRLADATDNVADADRDLADANAELRAAEEELDAVRQNSLITMDEYTERVRELQDELREGAADEEQAALDVERARARLIEAQATLPADSIARRQIEADLKSAESTLSSIRNSGKTTARDLDTINAGVIEGNDDAIDASERYADALRGVEDAERDAGRAREDLARVQEDNARAIADAKRDLARVEQDNARAIADAQRNLADAQRDYARVNADTAKAVEDAKDAVQDAKDAQDEAAESAVAAGLANGEYSQSAVDLAKVINGELIPAWRELRNAVQEAVMPTFIQGIRNIVDLLPLLEGGLTKAAQGVADLFESFTGMFTEGERGKRLMEDLDTIFEASGDQIRILGEALEYWFEFFANLGAAMSPILTDLTEGFRDWSKEIRDSFESPERMQAFLDKFQRAREIIADVWQILKDVGGAIKEFSFLMMGPGNPGSLMLEGIKKAAAGLREYFDDPANQEKLVAQFEQIRLATSAIGSVLKTLVIELFNLASDPKVVAVIQDLAGSLNEALPNLRNVLTTIIEEVGPQLGDTIVSLSEALVNIADTGILKVLADFVADLAEGFAELTGTEDFQASFSRIVDSLKEIAPDLAETFVNLIAAFVDLVAEPAVLDFLEQVAEWLRTITENKDTTKKVIAGLIGLILAFKAAGLIKAIGSVTGFIAGLLGMPTFGRGGRAGKRTRGAAGRARTKRTAKKIPLDDLRRQRTAGRRKSTRTSRTALTSPGSLFPGIRSNLTDWLSPRSAARAGTKGARRRLRFSSSDVTQDAGKYVGRHARESGGILASIRSKVGQITPSNLKNLRLPTGVSNALKKIPGVGTALTVASGGLYYGQARNAGQGQASSLNTATSQITDDFLFGQTENLAMDPDAMFGEGSDWQTRMSELAKTYNPVSMMATAIEETAPIRETIATWIDEGGIGEAFSGIGQAFEDAWTGVTDWFGEQFEDFKADFDTFLEEWGLTEAWETLTTNISNAWTTITEIFSAEGFREHVLDPIMNQLEEWGITQWFEDRREDLQNAWDAIAEVFSAEWWKTNVLDPIYQRLEEWGLVQWYRDLREDIRTQWNRFTSIFSVENFQKNVLDPISNALERWGILDFFSDLRDGIRRLWSNITGALSSGWASAMTYYNDNVVPWLKRLASIVNIVLPSSMDIEVSRVFVPGKRPDHLAKGGVIPGYRPGKDTVPAMLSPGEGVLVPQAVRALGPDLILWLNKNWGKLKRGGGTLPTQHFATGGVVKPVKATGQPMSIKSFTGFPGAADAKATGNIRSTKAWNDGFFGSIIARIVNAFQGNIGNHIFQVLSKGGVFGKGVELIGGWITAAGKASSKAVDFVQGLVSETGARLSQGLAFVKGLLPGDKWAAPVSPFYVSGNPYGARRSYYASGYHTGTDLGASTGQPLFAIGKGRITSAGWGGAYGNMMRITHNSGSEQFEAMYAHMDRFARRTGDVNPGQLIGYADNTGKSFGSHLHFEIRRSSGTTDPVAFLRALGAKGLAKGGVVSPAPGGRLVTLGEGGRSETVVDSRNLNDFLAKLGDYIGNGNGSGGGNTYMLNVQTRNSDQTVIEQFRRLEMVARYTR